MQFLSTSPQEDHRESTTYNGARVLRRGVKVENKKPKVKSSTAAILLAGVIGIPSGVISQNIVDGKPYLSLERLAQVQAEARKLLSTSITINK